VQTTPIALHLNVKASVAKFRPLMAVQARMDAAKSAARMGQITSIASTIFVLMKSINALLLAKTAISPDIPCFICTVNHCIRLGASKVTVATSTTSVATDGSSWLCGTRPFCLAFCSLFAVGCSVFSAAGCSGMFCTCQKKVVNQP
jgi:hypothetical protein